ncbi:hypothetical protein HDU83_003487, partial [Entophlyctis luteolus]
VELVTQAGADALIEAMYSIVFHKENPGVKSIGLSTCPYIFNFQMSSQAQDALKTFVLANNILPSASDPADLVFRYDNVQQQAVLNDKPWTRDPNFFKSMRISALALVKMAMHARSGGSIEVMGLMQGKVVGDAMVVMDAFALPVDGTETRVNAAQEGNEYMVNYVDKAQEVGRLENVIGWYHSHPGYGCWLSGIDVSTQMLNQQFQEPFCAVVIDPNRTVAAGKVALGAFRTYPESYTPPNAAPSEYQNIPLSKIEDFGVHANRYYELSVEYFMSSFDKGILELLWNKYWLLSEFLRKKKQQNREYLSRQIADLAEKIEQADASVGKNAGGSSDRKKAGAGGELSKVAKDGCKIGVENLHGVMAQVLKNVVFSGEFLIGMATTQLRWRDSIGRSDRNGPVKLILQKSPPHPPITTIACAYFCSCDDATRLQIAPVVVEDFCRANVHDWLCEHLQLALGVRELNQDHSKSIDENNCLDGHIPHSIENGCLSEDDLLGSTDAWKADHTNTSQRRSVTLDLFSSQTASQLLRLNLRTGIETAAPEETQPQLNPTSNHHHYSVSQQASDSSSRFPPKYIIKSRQAAVSGTTAEFTKGENKAKTPSRRLNASSFRKSLVSTKWAPDFRGGAATSPRRVSANSFARTNPQRSGNHQSKVANISTPSVALGPGIFMRTPVKGAADVDAVRTDALEDVDEADFEFACDWGENADEASNTLFIQIATEGISSL